MTTRSPSTARPSGSRPDAVRWAKLGAAALHAGQLRQSVDAYERMAGDDPTRPAEAAEGLESVAQLAERQGNTDVLQEVVTGLQAVDPERGTGQYALTLVQRPDADTADLVAMLPAALAAAAAPETVDSLLVLYGRHCRRPRGAARRCSSIGRCSDGAATASARNRRAAARPTAPMHWVCGRLRPEAFRTPPCGSPRLPGGLDHAGRPARAPEVWDGSARAGRHAGGGPRLPDGGVGGRRRFDGRGRRGAGSPPSACPLPAPIPPERESDDPKKLRGSWCPVAACGGSTPEPHATPTPVSRVAETASSAARSTSSGSGRDGRPPWQVERCHQATGAGAARVFPGRSAGPPGAHVGGRGVARDGEQPGSRAGVPEGVRRHAERPAGPPGPAARGRCVRRPLAAARARSVVRADRARHLPGAAQSVSGHARPRSEPSSASTS